MRGLPVLDRLQLLAKALVGHFTDDAGEVAQGLLTGLYPGKTRTPPNRTTVNYLQGYSTMPWLRAVAGRIGGDIGAIEWKLFVERKGGVPVRSAARRMNREDRRKYIKKHLKKPHHKKPTNVIMSGETEIEEITDHIFLDAFNNMNPFMIGEAARKITTIHIDLVGEAFWLKARNGFSAPVGFYPLPPHWIQSTPTPSHRFFTVGYRSWRREIPDTEILWMAEPDPENPYGRGSGMGQALADELETDEYAAKYAKQFYYNSGRPDFIVMPKGGKTLGRPAIKDLEDSWLKGHQGLFRHFKPRFLSEEVGIHEFQNNFRSLQFTGIRDQERNIILNVFGFPPEVLGILENSNKATITAADFLYAKHVLTPRCEFQRGHIQERIIPEYDERLIVDYVSPIEEDIEFAASVGEKVPHIMTVDEWREMADQEPLPDGKGQVFAVPMGTQFVEDYSEIQSTSPLPGNGNDPPPPPTDPEEDAWDGMGVDYEDEFFKIFNAPYKFLNHAFLGRKWNKEKVLSVDRDEVLDTSHAICGCVDAGDWKSAEIIHKVAFADDPDDLPELPRTVGRLEPKFRREFMLAMKNRQDQVDLSQLERAARSGNWVALEHELQLHKLDEDLLGLSPLLQEGYMVGADVAHRLAAFDMGTSFDLVNPHAAMFARRHGGELISHLTNETQKAIPQIRELIETSFTGGIAPEALERRLRASVQTIGLLPRQVTAVRNFMVRLIEEGVSEAELEKRVVRYGKAQLRVRGLMIARTELIRASNEGQQGLWLEAKNQGFLTGEEKRVWLVTLDESLDTHICEPLMERKAGLNEPFVHPVTGATYMNPPTHPNCRCAVGLKAPEEPEQE